MDALRVYDPEGKAVCEPNKPREWPALEIARRRGCHASQASLLVWLFVRLGYCGGTLVFNRLDAIRDGACSSEPAFRRALARLDALGLVQRDHERSRPGADVVHVLRTFQPELQSFFSFDQCATSTAAAASRDTIEPAHDAAADCVTGPRIGPCEQSTPRGMNAAKYVLPATSKTLDVCQGGVRAERFDPTPHIDAPSERLRPVASAQQAIDVPRPVGSPAAAGNERAEHRNSPRDRKPRGCSAIGDVLAELHPAERPGRQVVHQYALRVQVQLRRMGDKNPYYSVAKRFAVLLLRGGRYADAAQAILAKVEHMSARGELARPGAYATQALKRQVAELGLDWEAMT